MSPKWLVGLGTASNNASDMVVKCLDWIAKSRTAAAVSWSDSAVKDPIAGKCTPASLDRKQHPSVDIDADTGEGAADLEALEQECLGSLWKMSCSTYPQFKRSSMWDRPLRQARS